MDTKAQNFPITHSNSRHQSHPCTHCDCGHLCPNCSWSQSGHQSSKQSPAGHCNPPGPRSRTPRPSPPPKRRADTMLSPHCPARPATCSCSCYPKNRKNLEKKAKKRKVVKRSQRVSKAKRRSSGRKYN